jgi:glycosyltransferase involved in cell wall biosynthesis
MALAKTALRRGLASRIPLDHEPLRFDALAFNTTPIANDDAALEISRTPPERIVDGAPLERFAALTPPPLTRPRRILFIGRLHPVKDPLTLISACARLQTLPETSDLELTLVGWRHDPGYVKRLEEAISKAPRSERIRMMDPVDYGEVPELLARHEILVVPSQVDPLPRTAAEGMAAGLAVVVSGNTGISELIANGEHALVFPAGDVEALARALRTLMLEPGLAERLRAAGRKHALASFSTKRMADDIESFLARAIERFGRAAADRHDQQRLARAG